MQNGKFSRSLNYLMLTLSGALAFSASTLAADSSSTAQYQVNTDKNVAEQISNHNFTAAELEQMLAPIALYPDALLTHILIATTYPIEVVDAERWLSQNSQLNTEQLADAAEDKDWDASVKALLPFPNILKKLSEDLYWMRNLGDAFLQDEAQVLASVQILRQQADQTGNLESMSNVRVVRETKTIIIEPRQPDIIYVPYYDTRVVYGHWRWSHYPPVFWHQPVHYVSHQGPYYWHNPVHLSIGLFFGAVHWNNRHVIVHHRKSRYYKHHSNKKVATNYQAQRWQHNPRRRKGVAYRTTNMQKKYRGHSLSVQQHKVLRSQQKHFVEHNVGATKNSSRKHQSLQQKLKVNKAVKINRHKVKKESHTKHQADKRAKWQQTNRVVKNQHHKVKTTKALTPAAKPYANKQNLAKSYQQKGQRYRAQVNTNNKVVKQTQPKPVQVTKNTYKKSESSKVERRTNKASNVKGSHHRKRHSSKTQQRRAKQHN